MGVWGEVEFFHFIFHLVGSIGASMPNFSFLEGAILTIPGVGSGRVGELRNKTKLLPSSVSVELGLSLAVCISIMPAEENRLIRSFHIAAN